MSSASQSAACSRVRGPPPNGGGNSHAATSAFPKSSAYIAACSGWGRSPRSRAVSTMSSATGETVTGRAALARNRQAEGAVREQPAGQNQADRFEAPGPKSDSNSVAATEGVEIDEERRTT